MAGELCSGANALLQLLLIILKLPWDKIISLIKNMLGETPLASELSRIGKIEFYMTPGGIKDVEFDFYLPILNLKSDSEVILRNLVAYEGLMLEKGTFLNLDFTEYVDLMCGIIDNVKDVRILHEKNIIKVDLDEDEIVKLFNGVTKSSFKTDEASGLQKTLARVNKYYGNVPRVKLVTMAPQTRSTTGPDDEVRESLRESISTLMRKEMEKLMAEMKADAIAATASGSGMVVRSQAEAQRGMQYHKVTKIDLPRFGGEDVSHPQNMLQRK
nr:putative UPF0481 protein At3g02645 [Tanacetum cinerariifolium]